MLNAGKQGMRLDLKKPQGRAIFLDLAAEADVVVENFAPGVMHRLGIGWTCCTRSMHDWFWLPGVPTATILPPRA
jgi:crotonobetainyl-CoA:carnitine CoA-transferase CaiB-like acyl-CoA transferase